MVDTPQPEPGGNDPAAATEATGTLVLSGARLADGRTVDVRLAGDRIEAVGTAKSLTGATPPAHGTRVDLAGYLLLPAPAEPHAHHETALTAGGGDPAGPPSLTPAEVLGRTVEAALTQLGHGATALRTHVRTGDVAGLDRLEAVLRASRSLRGYADLTTVAVPRLLTGLAGAEELALLRDAVKMGATAVGGCPDLDPDPDGFVEAALGVAAEHGCAVDLHTDAEDPARLTRLAAATGGMRPGVALGPCGGLARHPSEVTARVADRLAAAGVTVVTLPQGTCGVLTHGRPYPTAPVRLLRAAGVTVVAGSGALRDTANPVGRGDPLEAAYLLASRGEAAAESAYEMISGAARIAMGLPRVRVEAGSPAELLAVRGDDLTAALSLSYSRLVVHRGHVVARTSAVREYRDAAGITAGPELPRQTRS